MLDSYVIINRKPKKIIKLLIVYILLLFVVLFILINKLTYIPYLVKNSKIIFKDDDYYLILEVSPNELNTISLKNKIIIDNKEYSYKIYKISSEISNSNKQKIYLNVNRLPKLYKINNYSLLIKVKKDKKRVLNCLIGGEI